MKKLCLLLMVVLLVLCSACSNASVKNAEEELKDSVANAMDSDNKYVLMVKNGYRENNPALTYDKAFSAFFGAPRWKYFKANEGENIVEFTGDCIYQDVAVKARIQFVVDEKQGTFEATYLALNEVPQNRIILASLIEKAFMPAPKQAAATMTGTPNGEQAKSGGNKPPTEVASKEASIKYNNAAARKLIMDWVGEHEFPNSPSLSLSPGAADGSMYEVEGKGYHMFVLSGLYRAVDILVDPYTGELLFHDIGIKPYSLNKWYLEYRRSHK